MRTNMVYDAPTITAYALVQDRLAHAAREQILHEARRERRTSTATLGAWLVRLGQRLQTVANQPAEPSTQEAI